MRNEMGWTGWVVSMPDIGAVLIEDALLPPLLQRRRALLLLALRRSLRLLRVLRARQLTLVAPYRTHAPRRTATPHTHARVQPDITAIAIVS